MRDKHLSQISLEKHPTTVSEIGKDTIRTNLSSEHTCEMFSLVFVEIHSMRMRIVAIGDASDTENYYSQNRFNFSSNVNF